MSIRPNRENNKSETMIFDPNMLRSELDLMRSNAALETLDMSRSINAHMHLNQGSGDAQTIGVMSQAMREFDALQPAEQQAASLGIHPDSFRPLKELNEQHFAALKTANALSPQLEANIKAYQSVASQSLKLEA